MLCALWLLVDTLNASNQNRSRIITAAVLLAGFMWSTYLIGGYWYVEFYGADKAIIKQGPFPAAHGFFMEAKEHVFLLLILLATWIPLAAIRNRADVGGNCVLLLWSSGLMVLGTLGTLGMEGAGALIGLGVKVALLPG